MAFKWLNKFIAPKPVVSILRLSGAIASGGMRGSLHLEAIREQIDAAFASKKLALVVLQINSPGGSPVQAELIYRYIRQQAQQKNIPVLSAVEDLAASGGYMLACAGDEIITLSSAIIGSIGVISSGFGFEKAIKKIGIERRVYTSGEDKSVLDPFLPEQEKDVEMLKSIQQEVHRNFIEIVKSRRPQLSPLKNMKKDEMFSGRFWSGATAVTLGMADKIATLDEELFARFGERVKIIRHAPKQGWLKRKLSMAIALFSTSLSQAVMQDIEEKSALSRYGI